MNSINTQTLLLSIPGLQAAMPCMPPDSTGICKDPFAAMAGGWSFFHPARVLRDDVLPLPNQALDARRFGRMPPTKIDEPDTDRALRRAPGLPHAGGKFTDPKPSGDIRYVDPRNIRGHAIREPHGEDVPSMEMGRQYVNAGGRKIAVHIVECDAKPSAGSSEKPTPACDESGFTPSEIASLEVGELLRRAIEYHRERYRRTKASVGSRAMREKAAVVKTRHERIFKLMELDDDIFPPEKKSGLVKLIHGSNSSEREAIFRIVDGLSRGMPPDEVAGLIEHIGRILSHGADRPDIGLSAEGSSSEDSGDIEAFSRAVGEGEIDFAVVNFARLLIPGAHTAIPVSRILTEDDLPIPGTMYEPIAKSKGMKKFLRDFSYLAAVARQTALIGAINRHVHEVPAYASRLADLLAGLKFPIALQHDLSGNADYGSRDHTFGVRRALPHGMVILWKTEFEALLDELKAIEADLRLHHSSLNFPVVVAGRRNPLRDGMIDLTQGGEVRIFAPKGRRAEVEKFAAERGIAGQVKIIESIPPHQSYLEDREDKYVETGFALRRELEELRFGEIDRILDRVEKGVAIADEGYPMRRVDMTRDIHRRREYWISQSIRNLVSAAQEGKAKGQDNRMGERSLAFIRNPLIPMEVKAALRDMMNFLEPHLSDLIFKLIMDLPTDESAPDYREKLRSHCRLVLETYFRHYPWAFEIMVEEAQRRAGSSGICRRVHPDSSFASCDGHIERFACIAEKLSLISAERVHNFILAVSKMPGHEDDARQIRRWGRFAGLNPSSDRLVFDMIEGTQWTPYVPELHKILRVVDSRRGFADDEEARYRAVIAAASASYTPSVNRAAERLEKELMKTAGANTSRRWEIADLISRLKYKLSQNATQEVASFALGGIAPAIRSWRRMAIEPDSSDQYGRDIAAASSPENLPAILKELTLAADRSEKIADLLQNLLARDAKNLGAMQHLLLAFYAKCALGLGDDYLEKILRREQSFYERQAACGKIKNGRTLQRALFDELKGHYRLPDFADEAEDRIAGELAAREEVAGIEFIPETGFASPDLRVTLNDGTAFLVEIKTLAYDGRGFANLLSRLGTSLQKAIHQISTRQGRTGEKGNRVIVFIYDNAEIPIGEEGIANLKFRADEARKANEDIIADIEIRVLRG